MTNDHSSRDLKELSIDKYFIIYRVDALYIFQRSSVERREVFSFEANAAV